VLAAGLDELDDTELAMVWRAVGCVIESEARLNPLMFSEVVINAGERAPVTTSRV